MNKDWIEKKIAELKNKICPEANISLPPTYEKSDVFTKTEANLDINRWKEKRFSIIIYPAFFRLENESEREFVLAHEIMHAKDVSSKKFGYDGYLGRSRAADTLEDLKKLIWEIAIDMRLENDGYTKVQSYEDRVNEYFNSRWEGYQTHLTLDLNIVREVAKNPTCSGIKELAVSKHAEWKEWRDSKSGKSGDVP